MKRVQVPQLPSRLVAVLLLAGVACSSSTSISSGGSTTTTKPYDAATAQKFQKVLDDTRAQGGFPGVIAGVWSAKGTWIGTSGTKGKGIEGAPAPSDFHRVGSLTKMVTATALLQLVEDGKVSLDDTIGKYVPGMPNGDTATLRQLTNMTSGISPYTADDEFQKQLFADPRKVWTPQQLVDFERGQPPAFPPGNGWEYSNTNYVLLGMVIEKVTGKKIAEVFQQRIFAPLGMTHSSFPGASAAIGDPHLSGITEQGQPSGQTADATDWNPSEAYTAGEIVSTLNDLKKWADALFTGNGILKPATQQLRRDSIIHDIPPNTATAGYGFGIGDMNGWWGHDGQIPGYTTVVFHNYDLQTTIIVLVNSDIPIPGSGPEGAEPAPAVFAGLKQVLG